MGASVHGETGTFHSPVGNSQLEEHRCAVGLAPGPSLANISRCRTRGKLRRASRRQEIPPRNRVQGSPEQSVASGQRRIPTEPRRRRRFSGSPPASARSLETSARMAVAAASTSAAVVNRPSDSLSELCASSAPRPERAQHVARFATGRAAGRSGGDGDFRQSGDEALALDAFERCVDEVRARPRRGGR